MKSLFVIASFCFGFQAFACCNTSVPSIVPAIASESTFTGLSEEEKKFSHEFLSEKGMALRVVFKTSVDFADEEGAIITDMDSFPKNAYSLKVCTETAVPAAKLAQMYTCCGHILEGSVFNKVSSNCYTLDSIVFPNPKFRLNVIFEDDDNAWFDRFYPRAAQ